MSTARSTWVVSMDGSIFYTEGVGAGNDTSSLSLFCLLYT